MALFEKRDRLLIPFIFIYLFLATRDITLPGIHLQEAIKAVGSMNLMKRYESPPWLITVPLFNRNFPLMIWAYHGGLDSYILLPFFLLLGINVFALRWAGIILGLLGLVGTYTLTKEFFNRAVAISSVALLCVNADYIIASKLGLFFWSSASLIAVFSLLCLFRWYKGGSPAYLFGGICLLGLGSSTAGYFLWFVNGLLVLAMFFRRDLLRRTSRERLLIYIILGAIVFCLGDFLTLYANLSKSVSPRFITIEWLLRHLSDTGFGVNNLKFLENLNARVESLIYFLSGRSLSEMIVGPLRGSGIFRTIIIISLFLYLNLSVLFGKRSPFEKRRLTFLVGLVWLILFQSIFTLSYYPAHHFAFLIPLMYGMVSSAGLFGLRDFIKNKRVGSLAFYILLFSLLMFDMLALKGLYGQMERTGGVGKWSDAIYRLAAWIKGNDPARITITRDSAIACPLFFLLEGERRIIDTLADEKGFLDLDKEVLERAIFPFQIKEKWHPPPRLYMRIFKHVFEVTGNRLVESKRFYQRDGKLIYIVYSLTGGPVKK